jgi:bifunctional non-homologous end joining protein LigD
VAKRKKDEAPRASSAFTVEYPNPLPASRDGDAWWVRIDGREVRLSNLDKIYWPDDGYTKGDLLGAYYNLAPLILPHLRDRPLTLRRLPEGISGPEFYEKQAPAHTPEWMPRARVEGHGRRGATEFLLAQDVPSLLFVANLGCIEFHPWHSRLGSIDRPDYAFFDLDPFPPITFATVRQVAKLVGVALEKLGLRSLVRTSGATGMQVYVPLDGSHTYEEARGFVERVCRIIHKTYPDGTTMEWEISKRAGKVFLDYAMVSEGRNIASAYSVRAHPRAPVSTPLRREELDEDVEPADFTIQTVWGRFEAVGDLFEPLLAGGSPEGQSLDKAMAALGMDPAQLRVAAAPEEAEVAVEKGSLETYKKKRSFTVTPEPEGKVAEKPSEQPMFMIHKHHATRLHYDLRLERGGTLVSFAIPKGLPEEPNVRRLAVHVEDHPMEYATFSGRIPEGEYGAGEVRIYDAGTYEPVEWKDDKITIRLHGHRLTGEWHLVQTDGKNWLAFRSRSSGPLPRKPMAPSIEPMLATGGAEPFDDPEWLFEVKWDGVRTLAFLDATTIHGSTRLISRRGRDVTGVYPELDNMHEFLCGDNGLVDGEIVSLVGGRPSFEAMQNRFTTNRPNAQLLKQHPVQFIAFDLLWLDGESLMDRPLEERLALLERWLVPAKRIVHSVRIPTHGVAMHEQAKSRDLEGLVAKKLGSTYKPGRRSKDWLKIKIRKTQDVVIVGWQPGEGARASLGSILVAVMRDGKLSYAGRVGTGFTEKTLQMMLERLTPLETDTPPVELPPDADLGGRPVHWVRPELVCEVEYAEFTSYGIMRAPAFKGLREDKAPEDCAPEE